MRAQLLLREKRVLSEDRFAELVVWRLPSPKKGSSHTLKYRLALVVEGICVLRFDESGKGDHKHVGTEEVPYSFTDLEQLVTDFWNEVENWSPS